MLEKEPYKELSAWQKIMGGCDNPELMQRMLDWAGLVVGQEGEKINQKIKEDLVRDNINSRKDNFKKIIQSSSLLTQEIKKIQGLLDNSFDVLDPEGFYRILQKKELDVCQSREIMQSWRAVNKELSRLDQMSGLYNRKSFYQDMREKLHNPEKSQFFLCYIDVIFFKVYNEIAHLFGDLGIKKLADSIIQPMLDEKYRGTVSSYRYGGEELFVVVDYIQGKIDTPEKAAEFAKQIKIDIKKNLIDWFIAYEKKHYKGRPVIRNFLRQKILSEKSEDVNKQMDASGRLEIVKDMDLTPENIKTKKNNLDELKKQDDKYSIKKYIPNIGSLKAVELIQKIEDLLADEKIEASIKRGLRKIIDDSDLLLVEAGGASIGVMGVDCRVSQDQHLMSKRDKGLVAGLTNQDDLRGHIRCDKFEELFGADFLTGDISYQKFYQIIQRAIKNLEAGTAGVTDNQRKKEQHALILVLKYAVERVDNARVGRLASIAGRIVERAKEKERDIVWTADRVLSKNDMTWQGLVDIAKIDFRQDREKEAVVNEDYLELKNKLDKELKIFYRQVDRDVFEQNNLKYKFAQTDQSKLYTQLELLEAKRYLCLLIDVPETHILIDLLLKGGYNQQEMCREIKSFYLEQQDKYRESLTGAYNEQYMVDVLGAQMPEFARADKNWTICVFDLDNLKPFNEARKKENGQEHICDHNLGDAAIMQVVQIVQAQIYQDKWMSQQLGCSEEDYKNKTQGLKPVLVRVTGGEEFVISFPGLDSRQTKKIMDSLNTTVKETIDQIIEAEYQGTQPKKAIQYYLDTHYPRRSRKERREKVGTITCGIVNIQEWLEKEGLDPQNVKKTHIIQMRLLADRVGELAKKMPFKETLCFLDNGDDNFCLNYQEEEIETYRSHTINFDKLRKMMSVLEYYYYFKNLHQLAVRVGVKKNLLTRHSDGLFYFNQVIQFLDDHTQERIKAFKKLQIKNLKQLAGAGYKIKNQHGKPLFGS